MTRNAVREPVWQIGAADLYDNYRQPSALDPVRWQVGGPHPPQRWPLFHASEADPEGGYRPHPYVIKFELRGTAEPAYSLHIDYLVIAPRLGHLEIEINGHCGRFYLRPAPATGSALKLHAALHTTLYGEGELVATFPGAWLQAGTNRLTLTCWDGAALAQVTNPEKIKRLDRMATGAGFIYQGLSLHALADEPPALGLVRIEPTVFYRQTADGLVEQCELMASFNRPVPAQQWHLDLSTSAGHEEVVLAVPAVQFGEVRQAFEITDGEGPVSYRLSGVTPGFTFERAGTFERKRKWTVYVAPHLHTDIGYTHRQWEVAERLADNLDRALDLLRTASGFAYHVDAAWVLDTYLGTRTAERRAELIAQIRAGRVGVAGNYVILLSHLAALEDLIRNAAVAGAYLRPHDLRPRFSAVVDVPSLTSALPDVLAGAGLRYLIHASNQDRGPFRVNGGLHRRSPFYWQGPAGGRVLVWLAKMYCELRKVCGSPPDLAAGARGLGLWLSEYERADYPLDSVLLYGQEADNTDLDPQPAQFVGDWNAEYAFPRLVPCAVEAFFAEVESRCGDRLETLSGDGGAYWEDGAGSTLAETQLMRQAQAELPAAERLAALAALHQPGAAYPLADFDQAWRSLLLFDEHTWGAFLSGSDPAARLQAEQWAVKAHFAQDAQHWARRLLHGAATRHSQRWNAAGREVAVYNPHSWPAGGLVTVEVAREEVVVDAATGQPVPQRRASVTTSQAIVEFWVSELAGLSYRRYGLTTSAALPPARAAASTVLENDVYRLEVVPERGCVVGWYDKALRRELVDSADAWGLGQVLYATGGAGTRLLSNQADLPDGDPTVSGEFNLAAWGAEADRLGQRLWLRGTTPAGGVRIEWRLLAQARQVDLTITLQKPEQREPEAVYVAWPLALPGARVQSDAQLGWVDWNADRLPGACQEWLPLQSAILASTAEAAVCVASPDVPLFCVGEVVRGRWPVASDLTGGRLFAYVLNNYWRTNYRASQGGEWVLRFTLTSAAAIAPDEAYRFGWRARQPLYAQRLSLQEFRAPAVPYADPGGGTLAQVSPAQVVVTTWQPARWAPGWVARFQEIGGAERTATLALPGRRITSAWLTDLMEYEGAELPVNEDGSLTMSVPAWGLRTVRFEVAA